MTSYQIVGIPKRDVEFFYSVSYKNGKPCWRTDAVESQRYSTLLQAVSAYNRLFQIAPKRFVDYRWSPSFRLYIHELDKQTKNRQRMPIRIQETDLPARTFLLNSVITDSLR